MASSIRSATVLQLPLQLEFSMLAIVIRCQNGIVVWVRAKRNGARVWVCVRDSVTVAAPLTAAEVEPALVAIAAHSQQLVGPILQVVQLEV